MSAWIKIVEMKYVCLLIEFWVLTHMNVLFIQKTHKWYKLKRYNSKANSKGQPKVHNSWLDLEGNAKANMATERAWVFNLTFGEDDSPLA